MGDEWTTDTWCNIFEESPAVKLLNPVKGRKDDESTTTTKNLKNKVKVRRAKPLAALTPWSPSEMSPTHFGDTTM